MTRLYWINLLRRLVFILADIGKMLDDPDWQLGTAVARDLHDIEGRADTAARLCDRLPDMAAGLAQQPHPSSGQLLGALGEMTMLDSTVSSSVALLVYDDL